MQLECIAEHWQGNWSINGSGSCRSYPLICKELSSPAILSVSQRIEEYLQLGPQLLELHVLLIGRSELCQVHSRPSLQGLYVSQQQLLPRADPTELLFKCGKDLPDRFTEFAELVAPEEDVVLKTP